MGAFLVNRKCKKIHLKSKSSWHQSTIEWKSFRIQQTLTEVHCFLETDWKWDRNQKLMGNLLRIYWRLQELVRQSTGNQREIYWTWMGNCSNINRGFNDLCIILSLFTVFLNQVSAIEYIGIVYWIFCNYFQYVWHPMKESSHDLHCKVMRLMQGQLFECGIPRQLGQSQWKVPWPRLWKISLSSCQNMAWLRSWTTLVLLAGKIAPGAMTTWLRKSSSHLISFVLLQTTKSGDPTWSSLCQWWPK